MTLRVRRSCNEGEGGICSRVHFYFRHHPTEDVERQNNGPEEEEYIGVITPTAHVFCYYIMKFAALLITSRIWD